MFVADEFHYTIIVQYLYPQSLNEMSGIIVGVCVC